MNADDPNLAGHVTAAAEASITKIARQILRLETLETRNSDALDFREMAVWAIREALLEAYEAGAEAATRAAKGN